MSKKRLITTGEEFSRLTIIKESSPAISINGNKKRRVLCECSCGTIKTVDMSHLANGRIKSCGCLKKEEASERFTKHNMKKSREYYTWQNMKSRCLNKNNKNYNFYGGRGITICDKWLTFEGFYKDMGDRPENKTLDRVDGGKGYLKNNCRWATNKEQQNNKINNVFLEYNGKRKTVAQWAEFVGINSSTLYHRFYLGWNIKDALTKDSYIGRNKH